MATGKQDAALQKAEIADMQMEGMRADLNDPRGYGNCFVDVWKWLRRKLHGKTH
jgi:hypothetical protein